MERVGQHTTPQRAASGRIGFATEVASAPASTTPMELLLPTRSLLVGPFGHEARPRDPIEGRVFKEADAGTRVGADAI